MPGRRRPSAPPSPPARSPHASGAWARARAGAPARASHPPRPATSHPACNARTPPDYPGRAPLHQSESAPVMHDLTKGSIAGNLMRTTSFMLVGMVFQTLYFLVDLYFVGRLGKDAVAAVSLSGNLMFVVLAATQMLAVGTTSLIARAAGRKDRDEVKLVFNQSQLLSLVVGAAFLALGM